MRYMAKVLKAALEKKFPESEEKDILKARTLSFARHLYSVDMLLFSTTLIINKLLKRGLFYFLLLLKDTLYKLDLF